MPTTTTRSAGGSARERLLAAADELFYEEGIQSVGIDKVIERAGVAKMSLYNTFGSKDELVHAYLQARHASTAERITRAVAAHEEPRARLLAVFDSLGAASTRPGYRGCAFVAATAEAKPGSGAMRAADDYRAWLRALLTDLAEQAGADDPAALARQLHLLYDGAGVSVRMDRDRSAVGAARAAAEALLDARPARAPRARAAAGERAVSRTTARRRSRSSG